MGLKTRIKEASDDQQTVGFTQEELENLGDEIDASLVYVGPAHRKRLNAVFNKLDVLLASSWEAPRDKGQAVDKAGAIYQFKLTLKGSDPPIWRRMQVPDLTLGELHDVLQVVMGWEDGHLHQFIITAQYYGPQDPDDMDWDMEDGGRGGHPDQQDRQDGTEGQVHLRVRLWRFLGA